MYEELNFDAKSYFLLELETEFYKKFNDKKLLERCYKEINILYDKNLLFIIEYLYKYKKENKNVSYYFRGKINNLLILYVLDLNIVNPVKYNLPYELFDDKYIKVDLINDLAINLLCYLDKQSDFKIVEGSHSKESVYEINKLADNHYLILPICNLKEDMLLKFNNEGILKTVDDYYNYTSEYIPIRIDEKSLIFDYEDIGIENVLENDFERNISKILMPKTFDDYVKIKSIAHSTQCYKNNQDKLIDKGLVNINNLIANKEDIYEYLLEHNVDEYIALEIVKFLSIGCEAYKYPIWNKYVKIMKEHNCDDNFINIISKILYISGRGEAVSDCLFALDSNNYVDKDEIYILC